MPVELLLLAGLIALNGLLALAEMAIITARKTRLRQLAVRSRRARAALRLADAPERFLSTIQAGITLVAILTGLLGAEPLGELLARPLGGIAVLAEHAAELGLVLAVALVTFATIVLGELVPKRLALAHADRLAMVLALPFTAFARLASPLVSILAGSCALLVRPFGIRDGHAAERVSEEEIRLLVAESAEQGVIEPVERAMVERVLRLGDRPIETLMTPRRRICWLDSEATLAANALTLREAPYSRYPVRRGSDDRIIGILEVRRLTARLAMTLEQPTAVPDPDLLFADLVAPLYLPEGTLALSALAAFRDQACSMALVVDEYGDLLGLVTPNDVLGAILGPGEHALAANEPGLQRRRDGAWQVAGALPVEELLAVIELPLAADEGDIHTVGGLIMARLGHLPTVGEQLLWADHRFEVCKLDGARIESVLITPLPGRSLPQAEA